MSSPIFEMLESYGIDSAWLVILIFGVMIVLIVLYFRVLSNFKKFNQKYERFMQGKDMASLEETVLSQFERIEKLEQSDQKKQEEIEQIFENLLSVYQKKGLVKYDAFRDLSGNLSYAVALLDKEDNGFIISSMYSREGCYSYAKNIVHGESELHLSEEEEKALKIAIHGDKIED